jgi:Na+-transporting methylmalonyl-CoA/oxaloacetate decarboxylase gamma subunit
MNQDSLLSDAPVEQFEPRPMPMPTVQPIGLSAVLDIKNEGGKVIGHYQWAAHKDGKMDSLVVAKVVKDHEGNEQILYKTYAESAIAKKVTEEAARTVEVKESMATVYVGDKYKAHDGTVSNYGISDLLTFQGLGFALVLCVLAGLWGLISFVSYILKIMGLGQASVGAGIKPASTATAKTIHPGMSDEKFVAIISAAAAHALGGKPVNVVKFRPLNTMDWTWAIQGRVSLHTHKV